MQNFNFNFNITMKVHTLGYIDRYILYNHDQHHFVRKNLNNPTEIML